MVQLLSRRGETVAVVSAAAAVGSCARLGSGGQTQVREAGALEALLPLLDGAFGSSQARIRRDIRREHHRMWARAMRSVPGAGHRAAQVGLQAAEASLGAISALLTGDRRTAAEMRQLGGLQTLVGIVGKASSRRKPSAKCLGSRRSDRCTRPPPQSGLPAGLKAAALGAVESAAATDSASCAELARLRAVPLIAPLAQARSAEIFAEV